MKQKIVKETLNLHEEPKRKKNLDNNRIKRISRKMDKVVDKKGW